MRRSLVATLVAAALTLAVPPGALGTSSRVIPHRTEPGGAVVIAAEGFTPNGLVDVFLDEEHRSVVVADGVGAIAAAVAVPLDPGLGRHWVTARDRDSGRAFQARLWVDVPPATWPQPGGDAGRTGSSAGTALTPTTVGDLHEVWHRDLEVLAPDEEIFVTDSAGEMAIPAVVVGATLIATWSATDVMGAGTILRRTVVTALDLASGEIRWRRVDESTDFGDLSFGAPVLAGGTLAVRWDGDRALLGIAPETGSVRWRRRAPADARFGDPLAWDDRLVIPIDRRGTRDRLVAIDADRGSTIWQAPLTKGGEWQLAADGDALLAAGAPDRLVGLDVDGAVRWSRHAPVGWQGDPIAQSGLGYVPIDPGAEDGMRAIRLDTGRTAWTRDVRPTVTLRAVSEGGALLVTAHAYRCGPGAPFGCEFGPSVTRVSALDAVSGRELWARTTTRAQPFGDVAVAGDVVLVGAGDLVALDLDDGARLGVLRAPEHPHTYGAQQTWAGQPIPTGSWLVVGAADGSITAFSMTTNAPRPDPEVLVLDPTIVPTAAASPAPTVSPAPPSTAPAEQRWAWMLVALGTMAVVTAAALALVALRRPGRRDPNVGRWTT